MRSFGEISHAKTRRREGGNSSINVEEVSSVVVDTVFHPHRDLGPELLESVYEVVLARMLEEGGWNVKCLLPLTSMACISTRGTSRLRVFA